MYGVVLWCDASENKAVIWCEDQGDLAFYKKAENADQVALDAGDWVQFDMTMERHLRFACNPRLVCEDAYRGLADRLGTAPPAPAPAGKLQRHSAEIIPFTSASATSKANSGLERTSQQA